MTGQKKKPEEREDGVIQYCDNKYKEDVPLFFPSPNITAYIIECQVPFTAETHETDKQLISYKQNNNHKVQLKHTLGNTGSGYR